MVENVASETTTAPQHDGGIAKHVEQGKIETALAKLQMLRASIAGNTHITSDVKAQLLADIDGANSSNLDSLDLVIKAAQTGLGDGAYDKSYEFNGNLYSIQSELINATDLDVQTAAGRHHFAELIVGKGQPKEVVEAIAHDMQPGQPLHEAAARWAKDTPEVRATKSTAAANTEKSIVTLAHKFAQEPGIDAAKKKFFDDMAAGKDDAYFKGDTRMLNALKEYEQNHDYAALEAVEKDVAKHLKGRGAELAAHMKNDPHAAEHGMAAAKLEAAFLNEEAQAGKQVYTDLATTTEMNKEANLARANPAIQQLAAFNTGTAEARAHAFVTAYTAAHKNEHINESVLLKTAEAFVAKPQNTAKPQAVSLNDLVGTAMVAGEKAMERGDSKTAHALAEQVADMMQAAGYKKDQVAAARTLLNEGADKADAAFHNNVFGMGHDEFKAVMSDPKKRDVLLKLTISDIENSTPGHLQKTAETQMMAYANEAFKAKWGINQTPTPHAATPAAKTVPTAEQQLAAEEAKGKVDAAKHLFTSADGKQVQLSGIAAKDLAAIHQVLHDSHVMVASNDSHAQVPNNKPAPDKGTGHGTGHA